MSARAPSVFPPPGSAFRDPVPPCSSRGRCPTRFRVLPWRPFSQPANPCRFTVLEAAGVEPAPGFQRTFRAGQAIYIRSSGHLLPGTLFDPLTVLPYETSSPSSASMCRIIETAALFTRIIAASRTHQLNGVAGNFSASMFRVIGIWDRHPYFRTSRSSDRLLIGRRFLARRRQKVEVGVSFPRAPRTLSHPAAPRQGKSSKIVRILGAPLH